VVGVDVVGAVEVGAVPLLVLDLELPPQAASVAAASTVPTAVGSTFVTVITRLIIWRRTDRIIERRRYSRLLTGPQERGLEANKGLPPGGLHLGTITSFDVSLFGVTVGWGQGSSWDRRVRSQR
jgi:hypothetical protein